MLGRIGVWDNRLAYVLGFQRLGHEVYLMGDLAPRKCRDRRRQPVPFAAWPGRRQFEELARRYGIWPRCCLLYDGGRATHGMDFDDAVRVARSADLLINISGKLLTPAVVEPVPRRVYVDLDPLKTQVKGATAKDKLGLDRHQYFFTVGLNVGTPGCPVPTNGVRWQPLCHPVLLDAWSSPAGRAGRRFTSVTSWKPSILDYQGRRDIGKGAGWQPFIDLPRRTAQPMEILVDCAPGCESELAQFTDHGWQVGDAQQRLSNREAYHDYLAQSRAEFSVARTSFVEFHTGWCSDRTARYLALGKPALVQATGVEDHLPTGTGLVTFADLDGAVAGIEAINRDYPAHCRAARALAEQHFDANKVLAGLLAQVGCG